MAGAGVIYLDTSVVLAQLLAEDRHPPSELWRETLVSSRLLAYEVWTRIHGRSLGASHAALVRDVLGRVAFIEIIPEIVARVTEPFPVVVRTLDALHLSSLEFLRGQRQRVGLATYDGRMVEAARALGIPLYPL